MPANDNNPKASVALQFSLKALAGDALYHDSVQTVTAPSDWDSFACIHDLLNGYGSVSTRTLAALMNTALSTAALPGSFSVTLTDGGDKVRVTYSLGAFSLQALSASNPFGFSTNMVASSGGIVTAPNDWTRGIFANTNASLKIKIGSTEVTAFYDVGNHAGVVQAIRSHSLNDALTGNADNLTALDGRATTRFLLNADGYVEIWLDASSVALVWNSSELRNILGFTGDEIQHTSGGAIHVTASKHPRFTLWLDRDIEYCEAMVKGTRSVGVATDNHAEIAHISTHRGWETRFSITGVASDRDMRAEALDDFLQYYWAAEHFTIYQNVNEIRAACRLTDGYSLAKCCELNYRVGRLRLVDLDTSDFMLTPEDLTYAHRYFMSLRGWEYVA